MKLNKVEEKSDDHILIWYVSMDVSINCEGSQYCDKIVTFFDVNKYSVDEEICSVVQQFYTQI